MKDLPYAVGERVQCLAFAGDFYKGTVTQCEYVEAGYANFVRVKIKLDISRKEVQVNWSLFPDRIKKLEER